MRGLPRAYMFPLAIAALWLFPRAGLAQDADSGAEGSTREPPKALSDLDGQYWVLDFDVVCLRMIAAPPASSPAQARWLKELRPEALKSEGEGAAGEKTPGAGAAARASRERFSVAAKDSARVYWYFVYTLSNAGAEDREASVGVSALVDGRKVYSDLYLPDVEKAVEKKEREPLWGKSDQLEILAKRDPTDPRYSYFTFEAGKKRKCVAIFNAIDPNASKITIRVAGLSNEVKRLPSETGDGALELEDRVLELYYERPGDEHAIPADTFKLVGREWVKRKTKAAPQVAEGQ